jgi:polar amino acid transport system substrate-binding protein
VTASPGGAPPLNRRPVRLALLCAVCLAVPASAADPTPPLRWGGDQEGGGPYVYSTPDNPDRLIGFEVEMMDALAQRLGRKSEFVQCDFKQLPDLLRRGGIDVIVNGYELTRAHRATKVATIPYYVYELQLIARRNDPSI